MERIILVGPSGSGKSTLAKRLADLLDSRHVELDGLWWGPDWTGVGADAFGEQIRAGTDVDRWVVDGNYFSQGSRKVLWPHADTVVFLDLPRRVTVPRVIRRTLSRMLRRKVLWNDNRESLRSVVGRESIVTFAWRAHPGYAVRYEALIADPESDIAHLTWVRLRSPTEVRRWLRSLEQGRAAQPRT